jgi:hypothetical protein
MTGDGQSLVKNARTDRSGIRDLGGLGTWPFDDTEVLHLTISQIHGQHGSNMMKTGHASCTRIHVQPTPRWDAVYEKNMAVTTDENIGPFSAQDGQNSLGIAGGTAADVCHPNLQSRHFETKMLWATQPNVCAVDVSVDRPHCGHGLQLVQDLNATNVSGMPNFIAVLHVAKHGLIEESVGVRKQDNSSVSHAECLFDLQIGSIDPNLAP